MTKNLTFLPSLQLLAQVKVVSLLWTRTDVKTQWLQMSSEPSICEWQKIIRFVSERARDLPNLPPPLKFNEEMLFLIRNMGNEIKPLLLMKQRQWRTLLDVRHWTPIGTVDYVKLAETVIEDGLNAGNIEYCLSVACNYCLEGKIYDLWQRRMTPEDKERFLTNSPFYSNDALVRFWIDNFVKKNTTLEEKKQREIYVPLIYYALYVPTRNNFIAKKFFFDQLPREFKTNELVHYLAERAAVDRCANDLRPEEIGSHLFVYLFNQMDQSTQLHFIQRRVKNFLSTCAEWPYVKMIVDAVNLSCRYLDTVPYGHLYVTCILNMKALPRYITRNLFSNCPHESCRDSLNLLWTWQ